ncbi:hypothetical protein SAMN04489806_2413 [Paramicrobacterium humi]|uniref:Uncharacterized protein n=1 Tax=Paramicrobacterium humi TaxID=640635 RepID=A0A1H4P6L4_9MICO|nr:hypothetical protein [Microbacterium humi]SEC03106.1 hypothetical protein SAMN04489806_2413 [Microbacterium humi]
MSKSHLTERTRLAGLKATSQAALGTARFGIGPGLAGALIAVHSFARFLLRINDYPLAPINSIAWVLFALVLVYAVPTIRARGYHVSTLKYWSVIASLFVVVIIDVAAVWGHSAQGVYPTAAVAVGGVLVAVVSVRAARDVLICSGVLAIALAAATLSSDRDRSAAIGADIVTIALATVTPIIAALTIGTYRRLSQLALDRVMIQGTVTAPVYGPGLLASERLASLDHEVEQLFEDVASGREPLPLNQDKARRAAELATELRSHLIAGRQNTWLYHAVTESDTLNDVVTIEDPHSSAALLRTDQRDGLLSALWFLVQGADAGAHQTSVKFGDPYTVRRVSGPQRRVLVEIHVDGIVRHRIEPLAWTALRNVGAVVDTQTPTGTRLAVQCVVDVPHDAGDH